MKIRFLLTPATFIMVAALFTSCVKEPPQPCTGGVTMSVFATGLNNPRGLKFGPDGYLYVAEGGAGGTDSTVGQCLQVPAPIGPYKGSPTGGRISRISSSGQRSTVTDNLPTTINNFGDVSGVGDVAFVGNQLYALVTGGGCSHGVPSFPNSIVRVSSGAQSSMVANLSAWAQTHPVAQPEADDYEPDGDWYSMLVANNEFYAVEANRGEVIRSTLNGNITRVADISATYGHIVPTAIAYRGGLLFVGNLNTFPIVDSSSRVLSIASDGTIKEYATGFTTILGLAFDKEGYLYVLENTVGAPFPTPGSGRIVRVDMQGKKQVIISNLSLPTGMTIGPDGDIYVSNNGFGPSSVGGGQVLHINLNSCDDNNSNYTTIK